jgi:hypothetical protein
MSNDKERLDYLSSMLAEDLVELRLWGGRYQLRRGAEPRLTVTRHGLRAAIDAAMDFHGGPPAADGGGLVFFQRASSADQPLLGLAGAMGSMRSFDRHISKC